MKSNTLEVSEDIREAGTLPGSFYRDAQAFEAIKERIFSRSWQFVTDISSVKVPGQVHPFFFGEGLLDEPLLLTRDFNDELHCISNVCTHRGNIVCESGGKCTGLRCRYHGRRFELDGSFRSMPECEDAKNFPSENDSLPKVSLRSFHQFLFVSLDPSYSFDELIQPMEERLHWLPYSELQRDESRCSDYLVDANWALYCDNYLEGFHVPYVHAGLSNALDYGSYRTELFRYGNLQVGIVKSGEDCFELPSSSPDYGQKVGGYYFWLFPNVMFNCYPWGISINVVKPLSQGRTRVSYHTYVGDTSKLERGAGASLDRVEREDQAIVESVQKGISSRLYNRGRFSPKREQGVHQFHRLIGEFLIKNGVEAES